MDSPQSAPRLRAFTGAALFGLVLVGLYNGAMLCREVFRFLGSSGDDKRKLVLAMVAACVLLGLGALSAEVLAWRRDRPRVSTAGLLRKAFAALVLAWLWTVFLQPLIYPAPIPRLTFALAAGLFGLQVLAADLVARGWPLRLRTSLELALFSLCLTAVAGEFSLRVLASLRPSPLLARLDASLEEQMQFFRLQPGQLHHGFHANSKGHNDEEFNSERARPRRVAMVGDSFSVGVVPRPWHYASLLEELLPRTEVHNFGIPGTNPAQYLALIESEVLDSEPDRIVLTLFAGNDLELEPQDPDPARRWQRQLFDRRNVLLWLVPERMRILARESARRTGRGGPQPDQGVSFEGLSRSEIVAQVPWLDDPMLEPPEYSPEQFLELEAQRVALACAPSETAYAEMFAVLEELLTSVGDVPLAVVLIPDEFQVDDQVWAQASARLEGLELERDRFQERVSAWLGEREVPVLDLLPALRSTPPLEDARPHLYHLRDTHFNARGNRVAAEALAEFLGPAE